MIPIGWWGKRLVCEGSDGRLYLRVRSSVTWFTRWWYKNLPQVNLDG